MPNGPTSIFYHNVPCLLPSLHLGKCHPIYLEEPAPSTGPIAFSCALKSLSLLKALSSLAMTPVATVIYSSLTMVASLQDQPKGEGRVGVDYVTCESHAAQQWTHTGKSWCGPQESRGEQICATSWRTGIIPSGWSSRRSSCGPRLCSVLSQELRLRVLLQMRPVIGCYWPKWPCLSPYSLKKEPSP